MDAGRTNGGILRVLELAEAHPAEIRADFRTHFHISYDDVGKTVTWLETIYLVSMLMRNPESWLQAAHNGWKYPVDHNYMLLAELFDLTMRANSKTKPKPMPRPWPDQNAQRVGKPIHSRDAILRNLERMNPKKEN
jgi:hypothetical protein